MFLLVLTLILANVKKRIGPNFLIKEHSFDRSDPFVYVKINIVCWRQSCNTTKLST